MNITGDSRHRVTDNNWDKHLPSTISPLGNDFWDSYYVLLTHITYNLLENISCTKFHANLTKDVELTPPPRME